MAPTAPVLSTPRSERDHRAYVARVQDAARTLAGEPVEWRSGRHQKADPWAEQEQIRLAWRKIAADLRATGDREDVALAGDVDAFVDRMPPIRTQQQDIAAKLLDIRRGKRVSKDAPVNAGIPTLQVSAAKPAPVRGEMERRDDEPGRDSGRER